MVMLATGKALNSDSVLKVAREAWEEQIHQVYDDVKVFVADVTCSMDRSLITAEYNFNN